LASVVNCFLYSSHSKQAIRISGRRDAQRERERERDRPGELGCIRSVDAVYKVTNCLPSRIHQFKLYEQKLKTKRAHTKLKS
jgi:hypothetical protein